MANDTQNSGLPFPVHITASSVSGPLPPPEILEKYDKVIPGLAERIVSMAEREQHHFHHLQKEQAKAKNAADILQIRYFARGQWFAFILALVFVSISTWLAFAGHDTAAATIGGGTIAAIVTAYIIGYRHSSAIPPSQ